MYVDDPLLGSACAEDGYSVPLAVISRAEEAVAVLSVASAAIVLGIVLLRTARQVQQAARLGLKTTLSAVLLRDGSLFFLFILVQSVYITVSTLNESLASSAFNYAGTPLFDVLGPILLSRFIINLRHTDARHAGTSTRTGPSAGARPSLPRFRVPDVDGDAGGADTDTEVHDAGAGAAGVFREIASVADVLDIDAGELAELRRSAVPPV